MKDLKLFQSNTIRSVWNSEAGEWYFSVVDVVGALSESSNTQAYWRKLKQRLKSEGSESVTICHCLKMQAPDGKMLFTDAAFAAGVKTSLDFAQFQNSGYMGLYGGETAGDIKRRKNLKPNQEILDHMNSVELGANLFRITQTEDKLRRENVKSKEDANKIHYSVGRVVRKTIEELGGTMPEELPTPETSIKKLKPKT